MKPQEMSLSDREHLITKNLVPFDPGTVVRRTLESELRLLKGGLDRWKGSLKEGEVYVADAKVRIRAIEPEIAELEAAIAALPVKP